jgi:hypothetical protein
MEDFAHTTFLDAVQVGGKLNHDRVHLQAEAKARIQASEFEAYTSAG